MKNLMRICVWQSFHFQKIHIQPLKMLNTGFFAHLGGQSKFSEALREVNKQHFKEKFWIWGP